MSKTIEQWFIEAKEQGYEWADMALANTPKSKRVQTASTLRHAITKAFVWDETDPKTQGHIFWFNIYKSITYKL